MIRALVFVGVVALAAPAFAQYQGHNFHGDFGVNSATQPGPGIYVALPFGQWNADQVKDADGNRTLANQFKGFDLRIVPPTFITVTSKKVLGANYRFMVAPALSTVPATRPASSTSAISGSRRRRARSRAARSLYPSRSPSSPSSTLPVSARRCPRKLTRSCRRRRSPETAVSATGDIASPTAGGRSPPPKGKELLT